MFFVDGYIPLTDVSRKILKETRDMLYDESSFQATEGTVEAKNERNRAISEYLNEGLMTVWDFCDNASFIGVQSMSGVVFNGSRQLLDWDDPTSQYGQNVNLFIGTVGSGSGFEEDRFHEDDPTSEELLRQRFGDFLFLPIVFRKDEFDQFYQKLRSWRDNANTQPADHEAIAEKIVNEFDNGSPVTKEWVKKNLAQDMKVEEFIATWKMAVNQRPDLSKPGPRKQPT